MADPLPDWKDREFAPSTLPPDRELTYPEPAGALPPALPGVPSEQDGLRNSSASSSPRLHSAAETIGGAMGSAVGSMRRLPENMKSRLRVVGGRSAKISGTDAIDWKEQAGERVSDLKDAAGEQLSQWQDAASDTVSEWRVIAEQRLSQWRVAAKNGVRQARRQAAYYKHEYPVQTIVALAGFAFVVGCALRIWRSNSD